jgi:hypothetical protein
VGKRAFFGCKLASVVFPETITAIYTSAFDWCEMQTAPVFPDSLTEIRDWAFSSNRYATLNIPKNLMSIGTGSLHYNTKLNSITVDPNNKFFRCDNQGILYDYNFRTLILCPVRSSVTIPPTVRSIRRIAFACSTFSKIILPTSVRSTECGIFEDNANLNTVIFQGNVDFCSGTLINKKSINTFRYYGRKEVTYNIFNEYIPTNIIVCSGYKGSTFGTKKFTLDNDCPAFPMPKTCHVCKKEFGVILTFTALFLVK